jgi:hypothetical protein
MASTPSSSRFATLNPVEFDQLIKAKDSINTQRSTDVGVKAFRAYLKEKDFNTDFECNMATNSAVFSMAILSVLFHFFDIFPDQI